MSTSLGGINVHDLLKRFPVHRGCAAESLINKLIAAGPARDPFCLNLTDEERRMLGHVLATQPESPGAEEVVSSIACLARRQLSRHLNAIHRALAQAEERGDSRAVENLLMQKCIVREAIELLEDSDA